MPSWELRSAFGTLKDQKKSSSQDNQPQNTKEDKTDAADHAVGQPDTQPQHAAADVPSAPAQPDADAANMMAATAPPAQNDPVAQPDTPPMAPLGAGVASSSVGLSLGAQPLAPISVGGADRKVPPVADDPADKHHEDISAKPRLGAGLQLGGLSLPPQQVAPPAPQAEDAPPKAALKPLTATGLTLGAFSAGSLQQTAPRHLSPQPMRDDATNDAPADTSGAAELPDAPQKIASEPPDAPQNIAAATLESPPAAASASENTATENTAGTRAASVAAKRPGRIGDQLIEMGLISKDQLEVALVEKRKSPKMLGELLVDLGFITEQVLAEVLSESSGYDQFDPAKSAVDPETLNLLPKEAAVRYRVFPISLENRTLRLAMADVYDVLAIDQVERHFPAGTNVEPVVSSDTHIQAAIDRYYGHELSIDGILQEIERGVPTTDLSVLDDPNAAFTHPLVRLVNAILFDAIKVKASDLHFEPETSFLRIRYRIDGVMTQIRSLHKAHWPAISHRLKIMAGMNIADKLNPQDGRLSLQMGNRRIDFRVSSLPTVHGENLVLRILDKTSALVKLTDLGHSENNFKLLTRMVKRPEGIIIVTGPTGSGKTTTLYAILNYINSLDINIMTLEDPVEYELSLIRQSQIREGAQMTFADGIKSLLRQDPDVILVGEVRDADTATMALRAAMTGHQVYTTLHTNDAAGALPRLMDLGMSPSLMAGNIIGIVAQRLVRLLCPDCKTYKPATDEERYILRVPEGEDLMLAHPVGCHTCRHTGYKGRTACTEIMYMAPEVDELMIANAPLSTIRQEARKYGFIPMAEDGLDKVRDGRTSLAALGKTVDLTPYMP